MLETFKDFLRFISGKKSMICGCIGLAIAYAAAKLYIGEAEVIFLGGLNALVFGGASYATGRLVYGKR